MDTLVDDVTFEWWGVSFMQHHNNGLKDKLEWMLTRAEQSEEGRRLQGSDGEWNVKQVKRYLRCVDCFLMLLMVCVHITSGQPGRGSEITTIQHCNGLLQDRNIFVIDRQVITVICYHKSQLQ